MKIASRVIDGKPYADIYTVSDDGLIKSRAVPRRNIHGRLIGEPEQLIGWPTHYMQRLVVDEEWQSMIWVGVTDE